MNRVYIATQAQALVVEEPTELEVPETRPDLTFIEKREEDPLITLGIETSCDETSVAVLRGEREILSNIVSSQISLHKKYGGIVPEVASRAHVAAINPAISESLREANLTLWDVNLVAATVGPGLIGSLIVGVSAARALSAVLDVPLVGVNHLEAHLYSVMLENEQARPPAVGLIVSGGHTMLVHIHDHGVYEVMGSTLDDAAGEAFDKVARFLGLGFPGGPAIDRLAKDGDPQAIPFPRALKDGTYDFSFSGLKTAVVNYMKRQDAAGTPPKTEDVCASFQEAVVDVQVSKTIKAALGVGVTSVFLSGGVAANSKLRSALSRACAESELRLFVPSLKLCTDNAAMVAACGFQRFRRGISSDPNLVADPNLPLA